MLTFKDLLSIHETYIIISENRVNFTILEVNSLQSLLDLCNLWRLDNHSTISFNNRVARQSR